MDAEHVTLLRRFAPMLADAKTLPYALTRIKTILPTDSKEAVLISPLIIEAEALHERVLEREDLLSPGWYVFTNEEQEEAALLAQKIDRALLSL